MFLYRMAFGFIPIAGVILGGLAIPALLQANTLAEAGLTVEADTRRLLGLLGVGVAVNSFWAGLILRKMCRHML